MTTATMSEQDQFRKDMEVFGRFWLGRVLEREDLKDVEAKYREGLETFADLWVLAYRQGQRDSFMARKLEEK